MHTPLPLSLATAAAAADLALLALAILGDPESEGRPLVLPEHGQDACDGLAHDLDLGKLVWCATSDLGHAQGSQLALQVLELVQELLLALAPQLMSLNFSCRDRGRGLLKGRAWER